MVATLPYFSHGLGGVTFSLSLSVYGGSAMVRSTLTWPPSGIGWMIEGGAVPGYLLSCMDESWPRGGTTIALFLVNTIGYVASLTQGLWIPTNLVPEDASANPGLDGDVRWSRHACADGDSSRTRTRSWVDHRPTRMGVGGLRWD
jgi:hypothetical protein